MKSISVIIATLNSSQTLKKCLQSIRNQAYDQRKIEILAADGGSTDKTIEIIKKYGGKVIPEKTGSPEAAKAIALKQAKNEIILQVDDDNILPSKTWLKRMIGFLDNHPEAIACYPWRYTYRKKDKLLNRYFALFGVNDPVAWFLGKADRQSYLKSTWDLLGKAEDKGDYFLVEFDRENIPTLGANGFLIKRKILLKAKTDPKYFFHIDVNVDLIRQGFNKYIVAKTDIIHASGESFWRFFKKRKRYMENLYLKDLSKRRYLLYDKARDRKKIIVYSLYSLTLIGPIFHAFLGYRKIKDLAWFLHPVVCFLIFWIYFLCVVNWQLWHYLGIFKKKFNL